MAPFHKNGFVVACPRTREGVIIDPGDEVEGLLEFIAQEAITVRHILLTHAHVDHVTGVASGEAARSACPCTCTRTISSSTSAPWSRGRIFGLRVDPPPPPIDSFYAAGRAIRVRRLRGASRTTRRAIAPAVSAWKWRVRASAGWTCSSATRCLPGPSAARTCPAATTRRSSDRSASVLFAVRRRCPRVSGSRPGYDHRPGAADQSVSAGRVA